METFQMITWRKHKKFYKANFTSLCQETRETVKKMKNEYWKRFIKKLESDFYEQQNKYGES